MPAARPRPIQLVDVTLRLSPDQLRVFAAVGVVARNSAVATAAEVILALACARVEQIHGEAADYVHQELGALLWTFAAKHETPIDNYWESAKRMQELKNAKVA